MRKFVRVKAHPHAEIITAWANGVPVQMWNDSGQYWGNVQRPDAQGSVTPMFPSWVNFRVAPITLPVWVRLHYSKGSRTIFTAEAADWGDATPRYVAGLFESRDSAEEYTEQRESFGGWLSNWILIGDVEIPGSDSDWAIAEAA